MLGDGHARALDHEHLGQALADRLGQVAHLLEVGLAVVVDPLPNLLGPEFGQLEAGYLVAKVFAA